MEFSPKTRKGIYQNSSFSKTTENQVYLLKG